MGEVCPALKQWIVAFNQHSSNLQHIRGVSVTDHCCLLDGRRLAQVAPSCYCSPAPCRPIALILDTDQSYEDDRQFAACQCSAKFKLYVMSLR